MEKFVITVLFSVKPGNLDEIMPLLYQNVEKSLGEEEGCLQFDVVQRQDDDHSFIFYEIYKDIAAFEFHLKTAHSVEFNNKLKEMGDKTTRKPIKGFLVSN